MGQPKLFRIDEKIRQEGKDVTWAQALLSRGNLRVKHLNQAGAVPARRNDSTDIRSNTTIPSAANSSANRASCIFGPSLQGKDSMGQSQTQDLMLPQTHRRRLKSIVLPCRVDGTPGARL